MKGKYEPSNGPSASTIPSPHKSQYSAKEENTFASYRSFSGEDLSHETRNSFHRQITHDGN